MTSTPSSRPSFYSPQLDGLRFIAALLVFIHHAPPLPILWKIGAIGWIGVDLFLCISAFLLARLLSLEFHRTGTLKIRNFFIRRALRIWPLYLCYASFACVLGVVWFELDTVSVLGWWFSHITFTNNIMTAIEGYSPIPFSEHLWTISLEEQAYLIMPFLLLAYFLSRAPKAHLKLFAFTSIFVLIGARYGFYLNDAPHPFVWVLPLRADAFILGATAAILIQDNMVKKPLLIMLLGVLLMSSVVLFPDIGKHSLYQVFGYTAVACGCVLVVVSSQSKVFQQSVLASSPMRYLGKISYGIYVYHLLGLALARNILETIGIDGGLWNFSFGLIITLLVSSISYALLEKYFLEMKSRFTTVSSRPV